MKWLKNRLIKWLGVDELEEQFTDVNRDVALAATELKYAQRRLRNVEEEIKAAMEVFNKYLRADADVDAYRGDNTIVLTGIYQGKGYVQFYDMSNADFEEMVKQLRSMCKCNMLRTVDAPPHFTGTFNI